MSEFELQFDSYHNNGPVIFCDDEPEFLGSIEDLNRGIDINLKTTTDTETCLDWIKKEFVIAIYADLRMPGKDGVSLLEEIFQENPYINLNILTGFNPSEEQLKRLEQINAHVFSKLDGVQELLEALKKEIIQPYAITIRKLKERVLVLEKFNKEWAEDLIMQLKEIPNAEESMISTTHGPFSVSELIDDIVQLRPRGMEHIRLWRKATQTLRRLRRSK